MYWYVIMAALLVVGFLFGRRLRQQREEAKAQRERLMYSPVMPPFPPHGIYMSGNTYTFAPTDYKTPTKEHDESTTYRHDDGPGIVTAIVAASVFDSSPSYDSSSSNSDSSSSYDSGSSVGDSGCSSDFGGGGAGGDW